MRLTVCTVCDCFYLSTELFNGTRFSIQTLLCDESGLCFPLMWCCCDSWGELHHRPGPSLTIGGVTSDAWSQWSDSLNPCQRRPWVLFSGVASVLCPVRKHKLVSSLVKCLHFSIIIHRSVFSPLDINVLCTKNLVHAYDALSFCFLSV